MIMDSSEGPCGRRVADLLAANDDVGTGGWKAASPVAADDEEAPGWWKAAVIVLSVEKPGDWFAA